MNLYVEIYKQAKSVIRWCKQSEAKNDILIADLENILKEMDSFESIIEIMRDEKTY